jgi:hypothetical protein
VRALAALVEGSCVDELSTEANAPLLGHALSLLLQVAECEASAGDRGSRALRAEAFRALEVLLQQARSCVRCAAEGAADGDATLCAGRRPRHACVLPAWHQLWPLPRDSQKHH